jgi:hypothetical protein
VGGAPRGHRGTARLIADEGCATEHPPPSSDARTRSGGHAARCELPEPRRRSPPITRRTDGLATGAKFRRRTGPRRRASPGRVAGRSPARRSAIARGRAARPACEGSQDRPLQYLAESAWRRGGPCRGIGPVTAVLEYGILGFPLRVWRGRTLTGRANRQPCDGRPRNASPPTGTSDRTTATSVDRPGGHGRRRPVPDRRRAPLIRWPRLPPIFQCTSSGTSCQVYGARPTRACRRPQPAGCFRATPDARDCLRAPGSAHAHRGRGARAEIN